MKLLYYASASSGGLANYAQEQANEISKLGVDVTILSSPYFEKRAEDHYKTLPRLVEFRWKSKVKNRFLRRVIGVIVNLWNHSILKREIISGSYDRVLSVAYAEYMSPVWSPAFRKLSRNGVVFGAVVQEPVRDFIIGPLWWHRFSIRHAYSYLKYAFVHDKVDLDTVDPMPDLETIVIPYGPHQFPDPTETRDITRRRLGIPDDALVLFSFGHIRDNKNLEYSIMALNEVPNTWLLVAGARNASSQKPESHYIEFAKSLGVADRCTWIIDYVTENEAANLFCACDLAVLTYSSSFRSASGVLHLAARYRKQCIASAGQGSLQSVLRNYKLGIWVEPDDPKAVVAGIKDWIDRPPIPDWEAYKRDNSWRRNAELVSKALGLIP